MQSRLYKVIILSHLLLLSSCGKDIEKLQISSLPSGFVSNVSVSAIVPVADRGAEGARIKITGSGFTTPMDITIGNNPCTAVSIQGSTIANCTAPASSSGNTNISVENITLTNGFGSTQVLVGTFTYVGDPSMWLDAQGGKYINTGIPSDNDSVTDWVDRSRSPKTVNQFTVGSEPVYKSDDGNGFESIYFSGSSKYLDSPLKNALYPSTTNSMFVVFDPEEIKSSGASFATGALIMDTSSKHGIVLRNDSLMHYAWKGVDLNAIQSPVTINEGRILATASHGNGILSMAKNGSSFNSISVTTTNGNGNYTWIGRGGNNRYYKGHIHEMIFYPIELIDSERAIIENYLNAKWVIY